MPTLSIKPAGLGDYINGANWEAALGAGSQIGECYAGDIGEVTINDADPSDITLTVASAASCNPLVNAGTTGFAYTTGLVDVSRNGVTVERLVLNGAAAGLVTGTSIALTSLTVRKCQFLDTGFLIFPSEVSQTGLVVENCVIFQGTEGGFGFYIVPTASTSSLTIGLTLRNCTQIGTHANGAFAGVYGLLSAAGGLSCVANLTITNCAFFGNDYTPGADLLLILTGSGGTETYNVTASNNATSDSTADDRGGSGHLVNQTAASWFVAPATNLRLKVGSPGIDAGTTIGAVTDDALGTARPVGAAYDIGAYEGAGIAAADAKTTHLRACQLGTIALHA